jgi:hypothetical protein
VEKTWSRSEDWVGTEVEGSYVMVHVESGKYVALNETASAIWHALETPRSDRAIADYLRGRFDVSAEVCDAAVAQTIGTMTEMLLVHGAEGSAEHA